MWFLYLDESGDLGFDFVTKKPSKFFTITILAIHGIEGNRALIAAVRKTLARKLNPKRKRKRIVQELKGTHTTLSVKQYFLQQLAEKQVPFALFSLSLNKRRVYERLTREKARVYNYLSRQILDHIRFENAEQCISLYVDRSKGKREITEYNAYVIQQLQGRIRPNVPLDIIHGDSKQHPGLQAADLFSWGIFQRHERGKVEWYNLFSSRIKLDEEFL